MPFHTLVVAVALYQLFSAPMEYRTKVDGWILEWRRDGFSQRQACRLHRGAVTYERQALTFRLSRRVDTASAAYRIDNGRPFFARDDALDLVRLGFALHDDDLANPSGGVVRIPIAKLEGARWVVIEPEPQAPRTRFAVEGFSAALVGARSRCAEEDFGRD